MLAWLKRLFGRQPDAVFAVPVEAVASQAPVTLEELDQAGIALGQQIDALRARRLELKAQAAKLRDGSN
jgi:cell division protein FtsB